MKLEIWGNNKGYSANGEHEPGVDPDLELCPFCGESEDIEVMNTHTPSYWVECIGCEAQAHGAYSFGGRLTTKKQARVEHEKAFLSAIDAWNTRCGDQR